MADGKETEEISHAPGTAALTFLHQLVIKFPTHDYGDTFKPQTAACTPSS